ncbi:MAG: hypothetical protein M1814_006914 [Vezdaea aestivalis]|nr:MAG: hypothetical protein M1814_006914 [Vezdaea aestivalis]
MAGITELPILNSKASAPGWAYVPSALAPDPSKVAIQPSSSSRPARKVRNYNENALSSTTQNEADNDGLTARQRNEITKRIAGLDRENVRDVVIPLPASGSGRGRGAGGKKMMTPAVRKILTSQKTFANHLDDEEAALAAAKHAPITATATRASRPSSVDQEDSVPLTKVPLPISTGGSIHESSALSPPLPPFSFLPPAPPSVPPSITPSLEITAALLAVPKKEF